LRADQIAGHQIDSENQDGHQAILRAQNHACGRDEDNCRERESQQQLPERQSRSVRSGNADLADGSRLPTLEYPS
jgi:Ni/Co efflux regulator RcnB